jgi:hypothetical protein
MNTDKIGEAIWREFLTKEYRIGFYCINRKDTEAEEDLGKERRFVPK